MLGSPILYIKGMRILMFQLSGFHYKGLGFREFKTILCSGVLVSSGTATLPQKGSP